MLEVCWDGLWTLSFGLSQFHGHGSWLVCEVALVQQANDTFRIVWRKKMIKDQSKPCIHHNILVIRPSLDPL
jgi:hypothetical protein